MGKRLVYLSPSNQTLNKYAYGGTNEAEQMQKVGKVVERLLVERGLTVYTADPSMDITSRANEANKMQPEVYCAIHSNSGGGRGCEAFYHPDNAKSKSVAQFIYDEVAKVTTTPKDRGIKNGMAPFNGKGYAEIRTPKLPIAHTLVEVEFHDNVELAKWIMNNIETIGTAIAKGICAYMKVDWNKPTNSNPSESKEGLYRVQVGAYREKANAEKCAEDLKSKGFSVYIVYR